MWVGGKGGEWEAVGRNGTNNVYTYEKMSKEKKMTLP
jgi:hypothetical protein